MPKVEASVTSGGPSTGTLARPAAPLSDALAAWGPPIAFGLRLWISVCLALYVAFWLELDNPFWAGTSAAVVCQPQLGASLRKGWFRMVGTLIGATMIVVVTACFPQERAAFLVALALWCAISAFAATVLRNFASYSPALAGYTAAIIAADTLGATGGPSSDVFMLAITRASEICIGVVCAGVVLAGSDLGGVRRHLAASFADLAADIAGRFAGMLALAGSPVPDPQSLRRELVRRVIALEPSIDQVLGESSQLRYHSPVLNMAVHGLFKALHAWRGVAVHLKRLADDAARQEAAIVMRSLPAELRSAPRPVAPTRWIADPVGLRDSCEAAMLRLVSLPVGAPSLRLLADQTAELLTGLLHVLDGLALLVDAPGRPRPSGRGLRPTVPDWLPAFVNAGRVLLTIGVVELFWIVTAWPDGAFAITFTAIVALLLSPRGDLAYAGALAFILGTAGGVLCAATVKFAVLPGLETFPAFCMAIGLYLVPLGFGIARSRSPAMLAVFTAMAVNSIPLLQPTNPMTYDTAQFYNFALAVFVGCAAAALSFRLLPPVPPALRTRRLLALALHDLRRLAVDRVSQSSTAWENRMYGLLAALPDQADPLQRAQLLAAFSVGAAIIHLRHISASRALGPELDAALTALAQSNGAATRTQLAQLEHRLASWPDAEPDAQRALQTHANILVISEALAEHGAFLGGRGSHEVH